MKVVEDGNSTSRGADAERAERSVTWRVCERLRKRSGPLEQDAGGRRHRRTTLFAKLRFHRHVGEYAGHNFDIEGQLITAKEYLRAAQVRLAADDRGSSVCPQLDASGDRARKIANWIAPPATGIKGKPFEFEYVRL